MALMFPNHVVKISHKEIIIKCQIIKQFNWIFIFVLKKLQESKFVDKHTYSSTFSNYLYL